MTVLRNVPVYVDKQMEIHRDLTTGGMSNRKAELVEELIYT